MDDVEQIEIEKVKLIKAFLESLEGVDLDKVLAELHKIKKNQTF